VGERTGQGPVSLPFLYGVSADVKDTQSQLFHPHATWRTSHTPPPSSSPLTNRTHLTSNEPNREDEVDQLHSSSLPPVVTEVVDDAPELPDPVDPPRDSAPFVESPRESTSPQPLRETRRCARTTPKKATPILSSALDDSKRPISTFSPSPLKSKAPYARQKSVPAPSHQHRSPFNKATRVFGRTMSDKATIAEEDMEQDSFNNDKFLNPRQRVEKLERESRRPSHPRASTSASSKIGHGGAEANETEEQHDDSDLVGQSLKQIEAAGDVEEEDIDAAFAEMDRLQPTYKDSPSMQRPGDRSSESPTPQRIASRPSAPEESLEESSHRDLFAESAVQPNTRLQRFNMPSSAESSRLNPLSQLATTSEKGFGFGESSQVEGSFPATQFVGRSPSKAPSSPSKDAAESPAKSTEIAATQISTSPILAPVESEPIAQNAEASPAVSLPVLSSSTPAGATAVLPSIPASRQLTRSRPNSVAAVNSGSRESHTSLHTDGVAASGSTSTGSTGAPSSRLTASRMLRRKSEKAADPDAALYSSKQRGGRYATPASTLHAKSAAHSKDVGTVEATQLVTQIARLPNNGPAKSPDKNASGASSALGHELTKDGQPARSLDTSPMTVTISEKVPDGRAAAFTSAAAPSNVPGAVFEPTLTDESAHSVTIAPEDPVTRVVARRGGGPAPAVFPLVSRLRAPPLQPEASTLLTPLPSSSPSRPARNRRSSPPSAPAFRAAQLESSSPRDLPAGGSNATEYLASRPSQKNHTLEVQPLRSPPKRQYGQRPARERKQTTRAKEGLEQERTRKAKKAEVRMPLSPAMETGPANVADDGAAGPAREGDETVSGEDDDDVSSATTASDPEDETFRMTQVQTGSKKQKRRRISSEGNGEHEEMDEGEHNPDALDALDGPGPRRAAAKKNSSKKQSAGVKEKQTALSTRTMPPHPWAGSSKSAPEDDDDGYTSPETPIDHDDHTFQPHANGKRKRGSSDRPEAASRGAERATRDSTSTTERGPKRRKQGRPSRDAVDGRNRVLNAADDRPATPSRSAVVKRNANMNGSTAGRKRGRASDVAATSSTPAPAARSTAPSTPLSSLPRGRPAAMRVLAHWASGQWFVGTTTGQGSGEKITIEFDDQTRGKVSARQIRRFELRQGDQIGSIRPPREGGVVDENYVDDGRAVAIVGANGKRKKVPISSIFVTTANVTKQWDDRLPDYPSLGLSSPFASAGTRPGPVTKSAPLQGMRFLLTIDEDARKNTTKDDFKTAITAGGGMVIEDWKELFDLPDTAFGSTLAVGRPAFCIVHGAQSTKPKALVALAAGIPCVASEWIHDASTRVSPISAVCHMRGALLIPGCGLAVVPRLCWIFGELEPRGQPSDRPRIWSGELGCGAS